MKTQKSKQYGFTMVELLVVIAIIAILVALLVPTITSGRQKANTVKCLGQLREWGSAFSSFHGDHDGLYPTGSWFVVLAPYVGLQKTWEPGGVAPRPGDKSLYSCPAATMADFGASTGKISYAMNNLIHDPTRTTGPIASPTLRRSHLGQPARFPILFDAKTASAQGGSSDLVLRHSRATIGNVLFADGSVVSVTNQLNSNGKTILWDPVNAL